jgi:hypothetical protein
MQYGMSQLEGKQRYGRRHGPRGDSVSVEDGPRFDEPRLRPRRAFSVSIQDENSDAGLA